MRPAENIEKLIEKLNDTTGSEMDQRVLKDALHALAESQKTSTPIRRTIMKSPIIKLAATTIIIAAIIGIYHFGENGSSVAWAEIAEHFESAPFFNLTIYIGKDSSQEIKKIQIWKSEDSRVKASDGNVTISTDLKKTDMKYADLKNRADKMTDSARNFALKSNGTILKWMANDSNNILAKIFWDTLGTEGQFSLDTLIKSFPSDVNGITPVAAADTAASKEIIVFEAKSETTPEHLTIWALRESKLPVQMQFRDPRNGEYGDFFFDYSEQKEADFFDLKAFKSQ